MNDQFLSMTNELEGMKRNQQFTLDTPGPSPKFGPAGPGLLGEPHKGIGRFFQRGLGGSTGGSRERLNRRFPQRDHRDKIKIYLRIASDRYLII